MTCLRDNLPTDLANLLQAMSADFPEILDGNLVGLYLWGSLSYGDFEPDCSDVDCVAVTKRDLDDREFARIDQWFENHKQNRWVEQVEMRFVIDQEFLDKSSRCCSYHYDKLTRTGSDGNPIIWINLAQSGITLWGKDARAVAPEVSEACLNEALLLELKYLDELLTGDAGDRSDEAFTRNAYAVLTACRILYSACHKSLVSKTGAGEWAKKAVPSRWHKLIDTAGTNRLKKAGSVTPQPEQDAKAFVQFVTDEVNRRLEQERSNSGLRSPGPRLPHSPLI